MRLSFPLALALLSALTVGGIAVAFLSDHRDDAWVIVPVVGVLGGTFLYTYAQRPGPLPRSPPSAPEPEEPFDDPVEAADRAERADPSTAPDPGTEGADDGPSDDAAPDPPPVDPATPTRPDP